MPPELDADMLATLTPEEREAIESNEYSKEDLAAMQKLADKDAGITDDDDEDDDESGDDEPADKAAADKPVEKTSADPAPSDKDDEAAPEAKTAPTEEPVESNAPRYEAKLPEDFNSKVEALTTRESEAWAKFESGDLDRSQLQAELNAISHDRNDLAAAKIKAEISQEMNQQTAAQQWQNTINRNFREFSKPENGGIDYRTDTAKSEDLDQFVKFLASKPENADKAMDWFLQEAHKRVQALHGVAPVAAKKEDLVADAKAKRKSNPGAAPATLAQVPGGDGPGDIGGEFAHLDALDGNDLEAAIAKMSPAQREKYAMGL